MKIVSYYQGRGLTSTDYTIDGVVRNLPCSSTGSYYSMFLCVARQLGDYVSYKGVVYSPDGETLSQADYDDMLVDRWKATQPAAEQVSDTPEFIDDTIADVKTYLTPGRIIAAIVIFFIISLLKK